jgi:hypothetical protein
MANFIAGVALLPGLREPAGTGLLARARWSSARVSICRWTNPIAA